MKLQKNEHAKTPLHESAHEERQISIPETTYFSRQNYQVLPASTVKERGMIFTPEHEISPLPQRAVSRKFFKTGSRLSANGSQFTQWFQVHTNLFHSAFLLCYPFFFLSFRGGSRIWKGEVLYTHLPQPRPL